MAALSYKKMEIYGYPFSLCLKNFRFFCEFAKIRESSLLALPRREKIMYNTDEDQGLFNTIRRGGMA